MKEMLHSRRGVAGRVWTHRDARVILPARTAVLAVHTLVFVTLLLRAHDDGVGTVGVAALLVAAAVPTIALMGVSGRLADTYDSRRLLSGGLAVEASALVMLAWAPNFAGMLAGVVVLEVGQAIIGPVWTGLLPRVVGDDAVGSAIAWQQGLGAVAAPIGAAAGGVLYGNVGATWSLLAAGGVIAVVAGAVRTIGTRRHVAAEDAAAGRSSPASGSLRAGLAVLRSDRVVWPTFMALVPMVVMVEGVNAVEVFLVRDELGATSSQYGLGELAAGVGGVVGAALAGRLAGDRAWVRGTLGGFALACAGLAVAGVAPSFWVYLVVMVLVAAAAGVGNASNGALVVTRTPDAQRGTVGAALNGMARAGSVVALGLGGLAGALLSPRAVFVLGGLGGMVAVIACGWRSLGATASLGGDRLEDVHVARLVRGVEGGGEPGDDREDEDQDDDRRVERQLADEVVGHGEREDHAHERADDDADDGTEGRHDHRLPTHRAAGLATVHADGA
jgi:MFS family permease